MVIVVDESLGYKIEGVQLSHNVVIKPIQFVKPATTFKEVLDESHYHFFNKRITIKRYELEEEMNYFISLVNEHKEVVYFYDGRFTNVNHLSKIRSWLLPDYEINLIPIENNAELLFYLTKFDSIFLNKKLSSHDITRKLKRLKRMSESYIISPNPLIFKSKKKWLTYTPTREYQRFTESTIANRKLKLRTYSTLAHWSEEFQTKTTNKRVILVEKGINNQVNVQTERRINIETSTFPINIPYLHVLLIPETIWSEFE
ncbi:hypothetical protein [Alkalihalobacillus sp. LMS39]|uniref:hypothetical protein n=1 Tax=Alkalihalobacillus sp. LMS39 TaxID=2924032 RepID=UPI001FB3535C|nr:hypothetical protein [Alkalihalobacillus sp. LMS39]UOE92266.1 hypothetical protein MM271_13455 [Alkalihalobacillus sp. LMS39]